jgi:PQQ-like domain/Abnormal spindle-like microcephaly-assoc'd, ASPM-SPD-2-Hydin
MQKLRCFMISATVAAAVATTPAMDSVARADDITISHDLLRTGWDPDEPGLSPRTVASSAFRRLFATPVAGQVYAQPLVVGNTVIVATEENNVYGLNAVTGAIRWKLNLGPAWPSKARGCDDLTPSIGITSTPVYDQATHDVYLAAVLNNGKSVYKPHVVLAAVNARTGHRDWQAPIQGAPGNDKARPFNALTERQRTGLLLLNGVVYVAFASYCDIQPFEGLVAGVSTSTHAVSLWSDEADGGKDAGIWTGGGGLMSDGPGRIFATSGNGTTPAAGPGKRPPSHLGDAVIRLRAGSGGSLTARDFFSPANAPTLDAHDKDFGSSGPVGLPFGTRAHPHLMLAAGKDGRLFVLDRDDLGGRNAKTDDPVSVSGPFAPLLGHPAVFDGDGDDKFVYYLGQGDYLRALKFSTSTAKLTDTGNSQGKFGHSPGSPAVTSSGTNPASAVVWVVNRAGASSALEAFSAIPRGGRLTPLRSIPIGTAIKFTVPATNAGRVYVGTDGKVFGFGDPRPAARRHASARRSPAGASPSSLRFGAVPLGKSVTRRVVITNRTRHEETITRITGISGPFSIRSMSGVRLAPGRSVTIQVTYAPKAAHSDSRSLIITGSPGATVTVSMRGRGAAG